MGVGVFDEIMVHCAKATFGCLNDEGDVLASTGDEDDGEMNSRKECGCLI